MIFSGPCKRCSTENQKYRIRPKKGNSGFTREYVCLSCERARIKKHQEENRQYWRDLNKRAYQNWSPEVRAKRLMLSHMRHKRLHPVGWDRELTEFVSEEAQHLRRLRNNSSGFKWHVDHIIPLNGRDVSGLHTWNNLQVIPASVNLSKGNR